MKRITTTYRRPALAVLRAHPLYEAGVAAFAAGDKCVPAHSQAVNDALHAINGPIGDGRHNERMALMDAWRLGWYEAHQRATDAELAALRDGQA